MKNIAWLQAQTRRFSSPRARKAHPKPKPSAFIGFRLARLLECLPLPKGKVPDDTPRSIVDMVGTVSPSYWKPSRDPKA